MGIYIVALIALTQAAETTWHTSSTSGSYTVCGEVIYDDSCAAMTAAVEAPNSGFTQGACTDRTECDASVQASTTQDMACDVTDPTATTTITTKYYCSSAANLSLFVVAFIGFFLM